MPLRFSRRLEIRDAVCLIYIRPQSGGSYTCHSLADVESGKALTTYVDHTYGLVPDGVARVEVVSATGARPSVQVEDNVFDVAAGSKPRVIRWLGADGRVLRVIRRVGSGAAAGR